MSNSKVGLLHQLKDRAARSYQDTERVKLHRKISLANSTRIEKPTNIMARSQESLRDWGNLAAILPRFRNSQTSRQDLYNLGEMEDISPRSRLDLESHKHHGHISARSCQSRRDLANLGEIMQISARAQNFFKLCKKLHLILYWLKFHNKKWESLSSFLSYKHLKLKLRLFFASHIVAMVTYCATKLTATHSPMIGQFVDTMISASTDKER